MGSMEVDFAQVEDSMKHYVPQAKLSPRNDFIGMVSSLGQAGLDEMGHTNRSSIFSKTRPTQIIPN